MKTETEPIEVETDHFCLLASLTRELAEYAALGDRGEALARRAIVGLRELLDSGAFDACCLPAYLALAPKRFDREIQIPIACADAADLDTRVLLWPVGAEDGHHPHCDGWAAFVVAAGHLAVDEVREGKRLPERKLDLRAPEVIQPEEDVSHHVHNRGDTVGLTIHIFGR